MDYPPGNPALLLERAEVLEEEGLLEAAEAAYRQAAEGGSAYAYRYLYFLERHQRWNEAIQGYRDLIARQLKRQEAEVVSSYEMLADLLSEQGELDEAMALYRLSIETQRSRIGPDHPEIANSFRDLARRLKSHGRWEEAERAYSEMMAVRGRCHGVGHPALLPALIEYADFLRQRGLPAESLRLKARVLAEEFDLVEPLRDLLE